MKISTARSRIGALRNCSAIAAAGMVTAVLVPTTAGASVSAPTGAESTMQKAETRAVASVDAAPEARLEVRKVDPAELDERGIRAPSACTLSDDEPYELWGADGFVHGWTCYEANGDDVWVWDTWNNDRKLWVYTETEYGKRRYCGDDTAGWTECKYDLREHECVIFSGYYQHNVYFGWTPWVSTTSGNPGCVHD